MATTIDLGQPAATDAFAVVDELVLRAVTPTGTADELLRLLDAGAPTRR